MGALRTRARWLGVVGACLGFAMVGGLLLALNQPEDMDELDKRIRTVSMESVKKVKKEKKPRQKKRKKRRRKKASKSAPKPNLSTNLSDVQLGLEGLDLGLGGAQSDLLGDLGKNADLVMSEGAVDQAPKLVERVPPEYPEEAHHLGTAGRVVLSILVGERGKVLKVKVVEAEPKGIFEEASLEAVEQWRFEPGVYQGRAVRVWARQVIDYKVL